MDFRIIEELGHKDRGRVGLWLKFTEGGLSQYMVQGGEIIEVNQTYHCPLDASAITLLKHDKERSEGELKFLKYIDRGAMGYLHQQDVYYGVIQKRPITECPVLRINALRTTRQERIDFLERYIGELQVEIHRCAEILWLMAAGEILDKEKDQQKKQAWLNAVRIQHRPGPGEQAQLF